MTLVIEKMKTRPQGRVFACRGFTMVELIVVIIVLGIIAVVSGPKFFSTSRFSEMGYADTAANSLRYAHKLAMASGCETRVQISASVLSMYQRASNCGSGVFSRSVLRPGGSAWIEPAPSGVTVGAVDIYFDGKGRPYDHASNTRLVSPVSFAVGTRMVTVESETGYVHQ